MLRYDHKSLFDITICSNAACVRNADGVILCGACDDHYSKNSLVCMATHREDGSDKISDNIVSTLRASKMPEPPHLDISSELLLSEMQRGVGTCSPIA